MHRTRQLRPRVYSGLPRDPEASPDRYQKYQASAASARQNDQSPVNDGYFIPHYKRACEAGVRMGCGCDSCAPGIKWGPALHSESREYVYGLGMPPLEAVKCATQNNAIILDIDHKVGTVKEGMLAYILIVGGDPLEKIENLQDIRMVLREGSIVADDLLSWGSPTTG